MITQPAHVLAADSKAVGYSWDGQSRDPNSRHWHPNKETAMDWAEHQRIVCEARKLLVNRPNLAGSPQNTYITHAFFDLYQAYTANDATLRVSKGIHQPATNPHLQIIVSRKERTHKFHLNVSAVDIEGIQDLEFRFQWEAVQFTFMGNGYQYQWPIGVLGKNKDFWERRLSISSAQLQAHKDQLQEIQREQQAREAQENARLLGERFESALATFIQANLATNGKIHVDRNHKGFKGFKENGKQMPVHVPKQGRVRNIKFNKLNDSIEFV